MNTNGNALHMSVLTLLDMSPYRPQSSVGNTSLKHSLLQDKQSKYLKSSESNFIMPICRNKSDAWESALAFIDMSFYCERPKLREKYGLPSNPWMNVTAHITSATLVLIQFESRRTCTLEIKLKGDSILLWCGLSGWGWGAWSRKKT